MQRIVVINVKGGCGKTTISTNLASYYAYKGKKTALCDYDSQASSMRWVSVRDKEQESPKIFNVVAYKNPNSVTKSWQLKLPPDTERIIVDTPPGLKGLDLIDQVKGANVILIPVLPSSIDMFATADFIRDLLLDAKTRSNNIRIAIIANRIKKNTNSLAALERFLKTLNIPVLAHLRDTQYYVRASEKGFGVHELKYKKNNVDTEHWNSIYNWLENIE